MITLRKSEDRGHAAHGWLDSRHSFSFAEYHDPAHMGFGNLRVLNDDRVAAGQGFGAHPHRDMEIVSVVLEGQLAHRDSIAGGVTAVQGAGAGGSVIRAGDVQRMSAGTGVVHSEFNPSRDEPVHFLQIWLLPRERGIAPGYEQKHFDPAARRGRLVPIVTPDGADGSLRIHADAAIRAGRFDGDGERVEQALDPKRLTYVHVARGSLVVNGQPLGAGDAAKLEGEALLTLEKGRGADVLVFDLAPMPG